MYNMYKRERLKKVEKEKTRKDEWVWNKKLGEML